MATILINAPLFLPFKYNPEYMFKSGTRREEINFVIALRNISIYFPSLFIA